jgi:hypothetical protein
MAEHRHELGQPSPNRAFMRKKDIARGTDPLRNTLSGDIVDSGSRIKQHPTIVHVSGSNKCDTVTYELVWARPVLPVIAILYQEDTFALKIKDE